MASSTYALVALFATVSIAGWPVQATWEGIVPVEANLTVGGYTFRLNLNSPAYLEELNVTKSDFPTGFAFGVGSSAAQVRYTLS